MDTNKVTGVLLADGWHNVEPGTFDLDSYEFLDGDEYGRLILGGGQCPEVSATGFLFRELYTDNDARKGSIVAGPLTSLIAVRFRR